MEQDYLSLVQKFSSTKDTDIIVLINDGIGTLIIFENLFVHRCFS